MQLESSCDAEVGIIDELPLQARHGMYQMVNIMKTIVEEEYWNIVMTQQKVKKF